ncbi:hypothetical protein ACFX1Q_030309 [Malus domestica]
MSTFTLHSKADIHNLSFSPRMPSQQNLSSHSMLLIPWGTSTNNPSKAKVFHIMKVESKSISYHAFSLSFSLFFFSPTGQGEREQSASTWYQSFNLEPTTWNTFPIDYLALLSSTHFSTSYASSKATTSAWRTDKGSENDTSKHMETMC